MPCGPGCPCFISHSPITALKVKSILEALIVAALAVCSRISSAWLPGPHLWQRQGAAAHGQPRPVSVPCMGLLLTCVALSLSVVHAQSKLPFSCGNWAFSPKDAVSVAAEAEASTAAPRNGQQETNHTSGTRPTLSSACKASAVNSFCTRLGGCDTKLALGWQDQTCRRKAGTANPDLGSSSSDPGKGLSCKLDKGAAVGQLRVEARGSCQSLRSNRICFIAVMNENS